MAIDAEIQVTPVLAVGSLLMVIAAQTPRRLGLAVQPLASDSEPITGRNVFWSSSDPSVATVDQSGNVVANNNGTCAITAICEGKTAVCYVTVTGVVPPVVAKVIISPSAFNVTAGATRQLQARAYTADNKLITGKIFEWSTSNSGIAGVSTNGVVTAIAEGIVTISAATDGITGTSAGTVVAAPDTTVATVTLSPSTFNAIVGGTQSLVATARNAAGTVLVGKAFAWESSDAAVATVSISGLVTMIGTGSVTITATSEGVSGTSNGTVTSGVNPVAQVVITPSTFSIEEGQFTQLTASPQDSEGNPVAGKTVTWQSSNTGVATVAQTSPNVAQVTAVAEGSADITATVDAITGTSVGTITPPDVSMAFEDAAANYINEAAFRANIHNSLDTYSNVSKKGTGGSGALYQTGRAVDLFDIDNEVLFEGQPTFRLMFPGGSNITGELGFDFDHKGQPYQSRLWWRRIQRFAPGFTTNGTGGGDSAAYKLGPYGMCAPIPGYPGSESRTVGRFGVEITNTTQYQLLGGPTDGGSVLADPFFTSLGNIEDEWTDGGWYETILRMEVLGGTEARFDEWFAPVGEALVHRGGFTQEMINPAYDYPLFEGVWCFGLNYNRTRGAGQIFQINFPWWKLSYAVDPWGML